VKQGDLSGTEAVFMCVKQPKSRPAGVRASIRAKKSRNGDGAKETQEVET